MGNNGSSTAAASSTTAGYLSYSSWATDENETDINSRLWSSPPSPTYSSDLSRSTLLEGSWLLANRSLDGDDPLLSLLAASGSRYSSGPNVGRDNETFGTIISGPPSTRTMLEQGAAEVGFGRQLPVYGSTSTAIANVALTLGAYLPSSPSSPTQPDPTFSLPHSVNDVKLALEAAGNGARQLVATWYTALNGSVANMDAVLSYPLPTPTSAITHLTSVDVRLSHTNHAPLISFSPTTAFPIHRQHQATHAAAAAHDPTATIEAQVTIATYSIIFFLSFVGNALVLVTLGLNRRLRSVTNLFLLNLAVADLLLGVLCMPATLVGSLLRDFVFGAGMCKVIPYLQAVSVSVGVWTLVAISLERYFAICRPLTSRTWQTRSHAYKVIFFVWSLAFVVSAPIAVMSRLIPIKDTGRHKCREVWPEHISEKVFNVFLVLGFLLVPLIIMSAMYSLIAAKLWTGMRREQRHSSAVEHGTRGGGGRNVSGTSRQVNDGETIVSGYDFPLNGTIYSTKRCLVVRWKPPQGSSGVGDVSIAGLASGNPHANGTNNNVACCTPDDPSSTNHSGRGIGRFSPQPPTAAACKLYSTHPIRNHNAERSIQSKRKVIQMLFVIVLEFFVCWAPLYVLNTWALFDATTVYKALGPLGVNMIQLLAYLSSCCNPITYCFMHQKFRRAFWESIRCRKCAVPQPPAYRQNSFSLASAPEIRTTSFMNGRNYIVNSHRAAATTGFTAKTDMTGIEDHEV